MKKQTTAEYNERKGYDKALADVGKIIGKQQKKFKIAWGKGFKNLTAKEGRYYLPADKHHMVLRRFAGVQPISLEREIAKLAKENK